MLQKIRPLKINIRVGKDYDENVVLEFANIKSVFLEEELKSFPKSSAWKMPYFTNNVKYSSSQIQSWSLLEKYQFLFDLKTFTKITNDWKYTPYDDFSESFDDSNLTDIEKKEKVRKEEEELVLNNAIKYQEITRKNIMITLLILFPYLWPNNENVVSSFETVIDTDNKTHIKNPNLGNWWQTFLDVSSWFQKKKERHSTFLKNSTMYTVNRVVWFNDIINNPRYNKLFLSIYNYYFWSNTVGTKEIYNDMVRALNSILANSSKLKKIMANKGWKYINENDTRNRDGTKKKEELKELKIIGSDVDTYKEISDIIIKILGNKDDKKDETDVMQQIKNNDETTIHDVLFPKQNSQRFIRSNSTDTLTAINDNGTDPFIKLFDELNSIKIKLTTLTTSESSIKKIKQFLDYFKEFTVLGEIYEIMKKGEIILSGTSSEENPYILENLKRYERYNTMLSEIQNFSKQSKTSRTEASELDNFIFDFFENLDKEEKRLLKLVVYIFTEMIKIDPNLKKQHQTFFATNAVVQDCKKYSIVEKPDLYYVNPYLTVSDGNESQTIYLGIDVFTGNIDDVNKSNLKCIYRNYQLGNQYDALSKKHFQSKFEIDTYTYKLDNKPEENPTEQTAEQPQKTEQPTETKPALQTQIQGGKRHNKTHKLHRNTHLRRTRNSKQTNIFNRRI